jgi:tetratricopeptide (TPR) repeat protein
MRWTSPLRRAMPVPGVLPLPRVLPMLLLAAAVACAPHDEGSSSARIEARERLRSGMELARQELHQGAVAELRRYLEIVPDDAEARFQLGRSLLQIARRQGGSTAPAILELRRALSLSPRSTPMRLQLAEALAGQEAEAPGGDMEGRREEVLRLYEDVLAEDPDNSEARLLCASWLLARGEPEDLALARRHAEAAIDLSTGLWRDRAVKLLEELERREMETSGAGRPGETPR